MSTEPNGSKIGAVLRSMLFAPGPKRPANHYTNFDLYKDIQCMVKNWRIWNDEDKLELGAWHYLPFAATPAPRPDQVTACLSESTICNPEWPVVLFLQGLGSDRVTENYRNFGNALAAANIQSIHLDYRGNGDSAACSKPTEKGVISDAAAALRWLRSKKVPMANITIVGYSLGTGIAAALTEQLRLAGMTPRALVLISGYTSIADVITKYRPGGVVAIGKPLEWAPGLKDKALAHLDTQLNTADILPNQTCPILLIHARDDRDLDSSNSEKLFEAMAKIAAVPRHGKKGIKFERIKYISTSKMFLRRSEKLQDKDGRWPIVWFLECYKGKHVKILHQREVIHAIDSVIRNGWRTNV